MRHTPCGCCPPAAPQARNSFLDSPEVPFLQRRCNCAFGDSSSQAPYPSPRRKRQVSSIALLVLSKQQTLRWFAVWFRFCLARKKYAKKRRWTRSIALTRRKTSHSVLRIFVTLQVKERPSGGVLTNSISLASARGAKARPFRCSSFPKHKRFEVKPDKERDEKHIFNR